MHELRRASYIGKERVIPKIDDVAGFSPTYRTITPSTALATNQPNPPKTQGSPTAPVSVVSLNEIALRDLTLRNESWKVESTARERECLQLVSFGYTTTEVASQLGIGPRTVETHVANVMRKLSASTRVEAVAEGIRRGWIE